MDDKKLISGEDAISGRRRVGADHRPVDDQRQPGQAEAPGAPAGPAAETDENRTLDPYHRHEPGEDTPRGSPARPKVRPVHEADEAGRVVVNKREG